MAVVVIIETETVAVPHVAMIHVVHHAALPVVLLVAHKILNAMIVADHVVMIDFLNAKKNQSLP
jgi:ABC-type nitrate/sulfonate/bicarbonate transport system ATPase subunit